MISTEIFAVSNLDILAKLALELWPDTSYDELQDHFRELLNDPGATAILLKSETTYIGFIELSTRNDYVEGADQLPVAYVEGIYVKPNLRKNGYGALLLQQAENWATRKGFTQICSDTELENEGSIRFHKASGFEEVSRIVCFVKSINRPGAASGKS